MIKVYLVEDQALVNVALPFNCSARSLMAKMR